MKAIKFYTIVLIFFLFTGGINGQLNTNTKGVALTGSAPNFRITDTTESNGNLPTGKTIGHLSWYGSNGNSASDMVASISTTQDALGSSSGARLNFLLSKDGNLENVLSQRANGRLRIGSPSGFSDLGVLGSIRANRFGISFQEISIAHENSGPIFRVMGDSSYPKFRLGANTGDAVFNINGIQNGGTKYFNVKYQDEELLDVRKDRTFIKKMLIAPLLPSNPTEYPLDVEGSFRDRNGFAHGWKIYSSTARGDFFYGRAATFWKSGATTSYDSSDDFRAIGSTQPITAWANTIFLIEAQSTVNMSSGSGTDIFRARVSYSGCATGTTEIAARWMPDSSGSSHNLKNRIVTQEILVSPCTSGVLTFTYEVQNTGNDPWEISEKCIVVTKIH